MHTKLRFFLKLIPIGLVFFSVAISGCAHQNSLSTRTSTANSEVLTEGRRWTQVFYDRQTQELWDYLGKPVRDLVHSKQGLDAFRDRLEADLGIESKLINEDVSEKEGIPLYVRTVMFSKNPSPFRVLFGFDRNGTIVAFGVIPSGPLIAATTNKIDYKTHARLHLPFSEDWIVFWGGRTLEQNRHAVSRSQRFAYDFVVVQDGITHRGEGKVNADYFCYGRSISAPASGKVVEAVDGIGENVPGQMNSNQPLGNHVVIDHGEMEFSILAHLQPGSLKVHVGDQVKSGAVVGLCGNSGNSSEPHLHYHLQDAEQFGTGEGLPAQFIDYMADGKRVELGEPLRGQLIHAE